MNLLQFHVFISLVAIASGIVVLYGLLKGRSSAGWTAVFLVTTVLTSITGFPLEPSGVTPGRVLGVILLVLMALAVVALYGFHLAGPWRWVYVASATASLYLNVFVGVVQSFQKVSFLHPLAPTGSEPPFLVTQLAVLALFIALGVLATRRFHPAPRM
jgi:hypothetical protein